MKHGVLARIGGLAIGAVGWLALRLTALAAEPMYSDEDRVKVLHESTDLFSNSISKPYQALAIGVVALMLAILIFCVWLLLSRRLRKLITERTRALQHEVEDKQRALEAHVESEERFRALIEQASDGIFIADPDWR